MRPADYPAAWYGDPPADEPLYAVIQGCVHTFDYEEIYAESDLTHFGWWSELTPDEIAERQKETT